MKSENKTYYYISILVIIITSFLLYSSNFYPLLNSDDALNILMAHYYKLPNDIYCWGQDRGGTLIPLISQVFIRIFGLSALTSVSISNYLILVLGYFGFSSLFKTNYSKILFGIIWFLPFQRFIDILRFPIGVEYSLIGIAIFLINKLEFCNNSNNYKKHLLFISIVILLITTVWVSDLAIITIGLLLITLIVFGYIKDKKLIRDKTYIYYMLLGVILGFIFIKFAKANAVIKVNNYLSINGFYEIKAALILLKKSFIEVLTFRTNEIFVSVYTYLVFAFIIVSIIFILKKKLLLNIISNKWIVFFTLDFLAILGTIILSSWVLSNGMGRWYFVASYISLSLVILLSIEQIDKICSVKSLKLSLIIIVAIGAISPIYAMNYYRPKTLKPMVDVVGEFKQLGKIGVIAEFWNSYIVSCTNPELIVATPHDKSDVRNPKLVNKVFERENLYVIKDMWMNSFPDTLEQFGYTLKKEGNPFKLGGCDVCKYHKVDFKSKHI